MPSLPQNQRSMLAKQDLQLGLQRADASRPEDLDFRRFTGCGHDFSALEQVLAAQDFDSGLERRLGIDHRTANVQIPLTRLIPIALPIASPAERLVE